MPSHLLCLPYLPMRNFFLVATAVLASSVSAAWAAAPPAPASTLFANLKAGKKQTVLVYGTSLTAGGEWVKLLKGWFDTQYPGLVTVVNSGGSGQNSDWGVSNLKSKVLAQHPDLVFIEFSFNDAHEKFKLSVEQAATNLNTIVTGIQQQNPNTTIVLQIMNPAWDANERQAATNRPHLTAHNENYRKCATDKKVAILDHYATWQAVQTKEPERFHKLIPDGAHPTVEGNRLVTWPNIQTWLEKTQAAK